MTEAGQSRHGSIIKMFTRGGERYCLRTSRPLVIPLNVHMAS